MNDLLFSSPISASNSSELASCLSRRSLYWTRVERRWALGPASDWMSLVDISESDSDSDSDAECGKQSRALTRSLL